MGIYTLSNREKRESIQQFYLNHPLYTGASSNARYDIRKISFKKFCSLVGITPTRDQLILAKLTFSQPVTTAVASHGVGKCVGYLERITLCDGTEMEAKDLIGETFHLPTLVNGKVVEAEAHAEYNTHENVYQIETYTGKRIIRNGAHPLYVSSKFSKHGANPILDVYGFRPVEEIRDLIDIKTKEFEQRGNNAKESVVVRKHTMLAAMPTCVPTFGDNNIHASHLKILAYLIGDGGLTQNGIRFTQEDNIQLKEFIECSESLGCEVIKTDTSDYDYRVVGKKKSVARSVNSSTGGDYSYNDSDYTKYVGRDCEIAVIEERYKLVSYWKTVEICRSYWVDICKQLLTYDESLSGNELYASQLRNARVRVDKVRTALGIELTTVGNNSYITTDSYRAILMWREIYLGEKKYGYTKACIDKLNKRLKLAKLNQFTGIVVSDKELKNIRQTLLQEFFDSLDDDDPIKTDLGVSEYDTNHVRNMVSSYGLLGKHSRDKIIPNEILSCTKNNLVIFLSRLFSTDGWASVSKTGKRKKAEIGFCSINRNLIEQVQRLLLRFGINSNIAEKSKVNAWTVTIHRSADLIRFAEEIGIYGKEEAVQRVVELSETKLKSNQVPKWRKQECPKGCEWEEIVSVKKLSASDTVAICVPSTHTFLTTFYEHNSNVAALLVMYEVICKGGMAVVTAPSMRQVKGIIFQEIQRLFYKLRRNPVLKLDYGIDFEKQFSIGHTFLREVEVSQIQRQGFKLWYEQVAMPAVDDISTDVSQDDINNTLGLSFGLTAKDSSSFQGLHSAEMLAVVDECSGVSSEIMQAIESCLTSPKTNHMLAIGNPITRASSFQELAKRGCYTMLPFTHPNVEPFYEYKDGRWQLTDNSCLDEDYEQPIPGAISVKWIEQAREKYGEDSLFWRTRVLAKFPRAGDGAGTMFTQAQINRSTDHISLENSILSLLAVLPLYVGVDVGDSTDGDPTVITVCQHIVHNDNTIVLVRGIYKIEAEKDDFLQQKRNFEALKEIVKSYMVTAVIKNKDVRVCIDAIGIGISIVKDCVDQTDWMVYPCYFNSSAFDSKTFANARAEVFWALRNVYYENTIVIYNSVLEDSAAELEYELTGILYEFDNRERIAIIKKEEIRTMLGTSPNHADSAALAVFCAQYYEGIILDKHGEPAYQP